MRLNITTEYINSKKHSDFDYICKRLEQPDQNAKELLDKIWADTSEEAIKALEEYYALICDRLSKSIIIGGHAIFINPYTNHVINKAYDLREFFRIRNENPIYTIIVFNRPDGTVIYNDEPIG